MYSYFDPSPTLALHLSPPPADPPVFVPDSGFALYSATPAWQAKVVAAYLSNASVIAAAGGLAKPMFNAQVWLIKSCTNSFR